MTEQNKHISYETSGTYHIPNTEQKLGSKVTSIFIEVPDDSKATNIQVHHDAEELVTGSPWSQSTSPSETAGMNAEDTKGEYRGGDIHRIAARSGVDSSVVEQAAYDSLIRQKETKN